MLFYKPIQIGFHVLSEAQSNEKLKYFLKHPVTRHLYLMALPPLFIYVSIQETDFYDHVIKNHLCDLDDEDLKNFPEEIEKMRKQGLVPTKGLEPIRFPRRKQTLQQDSKVGDFKEIPIDYRY